MSRQPDGSLLVKVRARAQEGDANAAVVDAVARRLRIPKTSVRIVSGQRSRQKTLELPDRPEPGFPFSLFSD